MPLCVAQETMWFHSTDRQFGILLCHVACCFRCSTKIWGGFNPPHLQRCRYHQSNWFSLLLGEDVAKVPFVSIPTLETPKHLSEAEHKLYDVVIIDTAGRLGVDAELMQQAKDIRDAVQPDEVLFVVDAMIGQDALVTAQAFLDGVGYDGVVLTKLDGDARGGAALSIRQVTGKPVMFASSGEKMTDFDLFHPDRMASRILDMGDMFTLIEQAERAFDADQAERMARKVSKGEDFTLEDFLDQLQQVKKLGSVQSLLDMLPGDMLPGMPKMTPEMSTQMEREMKRTEAIINSMTQAERDNHLIISASRRRRIALGSGNTINDVNKLLKQYAEMKVMMGRMMGSQGLLGGLRGKVMGRLTKGSSKSAPARKKRPKKKKR